MGRQEVEPPKKITPSSSIIATSSARRSPRLHFSDSYSTASTAQTRPTVKKRSQNRESGDSGEMSLALAVHAIDFENAAEEATPLNIYDPNLRRSPRDTNNIYRSAFPLCYLPSRTPETRLRRCTGFSSDGKDNLRKMGDGFSVGSKKRRRSEEDNQTALHGSGNGSGSKEGTVGFKKGSNGNSKNGVLALPQSVSSRKSMFRKRSLSENCSRKSPRLNPDLVSELLALPEPRFGRSDSGKYVTSVVKRLRNRTLVMPMHLEKDKGKAVKSELVDKDGTRVREKNNVGERSLRSRKIGLNLSETSPKSDLAESNSRGNDFRNKIQKGLRSRSVGESKLPNAAAKSDFEGSDFDDSGLNGSDNCISLEKHEIELPDDLRTSNSEKCDSHDDDMNGNDTCLTPDKIELELPVEIAEEKCESNVFSERCLRSRKIAFQITGDENVEKKLTLIKGDITKNKEQTAKSNNSNKKERKQKCVAFFIGEPIPEEEAQQRWHWRYELKSRQPKNKGWILNAGEEDETILNVESHYAQAKVDGRVFNIGDCAYIKGEGRKNHIGRILEFFKTVEGEDYFRVQWFFRAEDTVIKEEAGFHNKKRIFYSTIVNDNLLDCIVSKVNVVEVPAAVGIEPYTIPPADLYYDMEYSVEYSTFRNLQCSNSIKVDDSRSFQPVDAFHAPITATPLEVFADSGLLKADLTLLDLFAGCGGMSTGLCLGAKLSSINLVTRWAVDFEKSACDSLELNHPETQVRNESAEDFLELLKEWEKLCQCYVFNDLKKTVEGGPDNMKGGGIRNENSAFEKKVTSGEFEVSCLIAICYGDPNETGKHGVHFKVRWKGYGPDDDTWEPIEGLSNCQGRIEEFVRDGLRSKILPLPGDVDAICGGPPCQGISGYNRYRNVEAPMTDEKNQQIVVFMNIVEFLKPKYVLMENVVDILRLDGGSLGRYALSRLVHLKYQTRLGTIAAGCYGLPQFRLRVFLWGALPSEKLPPFPLPTHDVVVKYWPPPEFERNTVAYDEGQPRELEEALLLRDAISDLPPVTNDENREVMEFDLPPETKFQEHIRLTREEIMGSTAVQITKAKKKQVLYDHRPYRLNEDNYLRVCQVPHRKGANFRDLPGLIVGNDNVARRDTTKEHPVLPSGQPMVPDCVLKMENGKSKRPYARLWWDETVATVLTFPNHKAQAILHPEQDRLLTIRECARLQGFPDFYRFCGTVKERYCQIGNAVAIPVGRALGYTLGMAFQKLTNDEPLMTLPPSFSSLQPSNEEITVLGS